MKKTLFFLLTLALAGLPTFIAAPDGAGGR